MYDRRRLPQKSSVESPNPSRALARLGRASCRLLPVTGAERVQCPLSNLIVRISHIVRIPLISFESYCKNTTRPPARENVIARRQLRICECECPSTCFHPRRALVGAHRRSWSAACIRISHISFIRQTPQECVRVFLCCSVLLCVGSALARVRMVLFRC